MRQVVMKQYDHVEVNVDDPGSHNFIMSFNTGNCKKVLLPATQSTLSITVTLRNSYINSYYGSYLWHCEGKVEVNGPGSYKLLLHNGNYYIVLDEGLGRH